jgi:branched-chain amino acid transport system substrate-binding protein
MQAVYRALAFVALIGIAATGHAADTIRIALIEPLTGPSVALGQLALRHYQAAADFANRNGGALGLKFEIIPFDNQSRKDEALAALQQAIDRGIRYVAQGVGNEIAHALVAAIDDHNDRNPGRSVLLLNHGAGDPALTGARCSYWHFRFDANGLMKLGALTDEIAADPAIGSVYLINRDTGWGRMVSAETQRLLAEKRPDIRIVGDELHPANSLRDFGPHAARLAASGAEAVVTGNAGDDLLLLIQASGKARVRAGFYTMYAAFAGTPSAIAAAGPADVRNVTTWHPNIPGNRLEIFAAQYREKHGENWQWLPIYLSVHMLATAMETSRALEPARIVPVIEGLSFLGPNGPIAMRKDDHQLFQPLFVARLAKAGGDEVKVDSEGTGFGWKTVRRVETDQTVLPAACRMLRPK